MAAPRVDLKLGTALVQVYDGTAEHLTTFLDAVNLFNSSVVDTFVEATAVQKAAAAATVIQFVRTRLTGKARQAVTDNEPLEETLAAVKNHCASKVTADNVIAELKTLKQSDNMIDFCQKVEKITDQLKSAYLRDNIPNQTAEKMSTKSGLDTLIRCAKSNELKTILKAGTFKLLSEAIQKFQEHESTSSPTMNSQIYFSSSSRGPPQRGRNNFRGNRGRGSFQTRQYNSQNFQRGFQKSNWNQRGYGNARGNWNQKGHFRPNMFVAHQIQQPLQHPLQQQLLHYQMQNQQHMQQQQQLPQQQTPSPSIHPLGVPFGQHMQ